ncbi:hypothetical protein [Candidatus Poriferisodalis sp.]
MEAIGAGVSRGARIGQPRARVVGYYAYANRIADGLGLETEP